MTEKNTENKEEISFNEFKAWLTGLIRGKRGQLPDVEDWKQIKVMMDKVAPEVEFTTLPGIEPYQYQWIDHTGYGPLRFTTTCAGAQIPCDNANISVSLGNADIENLQTKINGLTSSTHSFKENLSHELNIAIDDLIKAQEAKV